MKQQKDHQAAAVPPSNRNRRTDTCKTTLVLLLYVYRIRTTQVIQISSGSVFQGRFSGLPSLGNFNSATTVQEYKTKFSTVRVNLGRGRAWRREREGIGVGVGVGALPWWVGDLTWSFHFVRTTVVLYVVDREHIQYRQRERERERGEGVEERERNKDTSIYQLIHKRHRLI